MTASKTQPKLTQKVTLYPSISAAGDVFKGIADCCVTADEMLAMMASPKELPNCARVWNTAPARACVLSGKAEVMTSAATVKRTASIRQRLANLQVITADSGRAMS